VAHPNRSRSIFSATKRSSISSGFGVAILKLLSCGASGETVTLFRSNISPIKFWARPLRQVLRLEGKRRSATEIVACFIGGNRDHPPDAERAIALLKSVFQYQPR
jgi:hypothetical protein